jgi:hypothetical protein
VSNSSAKFIALTTNPLASTACLTLCRYAFDRFSKGGMFRAIRW